MEYWQFYTSCIPLIDHYPVKNGNKTMVYKFTLCHKESAYTTGLQQGDSAGFLTTTHSKLTCNVRVLLLILWPFKYDNGRVQYIEIGLIWLVGNET